MKIKDVMDRDLTCLTEDTTLKEAVMVLRRHRVASVPVVDDDMKPVGFLSEKDIIRAALPGYFEYLQDDYIIPDFEEFQQRLRRISGEKITKYMTKKVTSFTEDDTDFAVAASLIKKRMRRAPIVSSDGALVGVVNREDIIERIMEYGME